MKLSLPAAATQISICFPGSRVDQRACVTSLERGYNGNIVLSGTREVFIQRPALSRQTFKQGALGLTLHKGARERGPEPRSSPVGRAAYPQRNAAGVGSTGHHSQKPHCHLMSLCKQTIPETQREPPRTCAFLEAS